MRFAIISDGVVVNVVEAWPEQADAAWVASDKANIGWLFDGEEFREPPPLPAPVPASVTRRQAREALLNVGLLDDVEMIIGSIEDATERKRAEIYWLDSVAFERANPMLAQIASAVGLTEAEIDDLFRQAAAL
jgi:hypothetical protein